MKKLALFTFMFFVCLKLANADETKLLRYPNSSKTHITFTHGGNIYICPIVGGLAYKLTSDIGIEQMSRFSPDGNTIAFMGQYDGNLEIYTLPITGGVPKRVTYSMDQPDIADRQGPNKIIMQWSSDGKQVIYRDRKDSWNVLVGKLYKSNVDGSGLPVEIPVPRSGYASLSPDGKKMAYNRIFREFRTWKRYRGGQADDIWIYNFETKELTNITNNPAQDIIPMWAGDKIYYLSDRTDKMQLYSYDLTTKQTKQITNFEEYDVKFPSLGAEHIAFENGGKIYLMSLKDESVTPVDIQIIDDGVLQRTELKDVSDRIRNFDVEPNGNRALFCARGEIFVVPSTYNKEKSITYNLTNTSGVHEREAAWSPNGAAIAYISDKTGYDEIYTMLPNGEKVEQVTTGNKSYRYSVLWSPNSKYILTSSNDRNLNLVDMITKSEKIIYNSPTYSVSILAWSPDSKWIAYSVSNDEEYNIVYLYSLKDGKSYQVSNSFYNSGDVCFSTDGKYLLFTSDRDFNPRISSVEWNFSYSQMSRIYGVCLAQDSPSPVASFIDYNKPKDTNEVKTKKLSKKEKEIIASEDNIIDINGLQDRLFVIPVSTANYGNLTAREGKLYYKRYGANGGVYCYNFAKNEEEKVNDLTSYTFTPDGKYVIFGSGTDFYLNKMNEKFNTKEGKLDLSGLKMNLNHTEEWMQVFNESWRHFEQFFYDKNMHGVDWNKMKERYGALLPYISHRTDLTYIIGEMIGELNAGHAYVTGGEMPKVKEVGIGLLGIDLLYDSTAKLYKIQKVLKGENWDEQLRSPLTEPGMEVKAGDYIVKIDDEYLHYDKNPYANLVGKVNQIIKLTIKSDNKQYDLFAKTIANEAELRYYNWVEERRHIVDSVTNGRIGYVHIPDMGVGHGLNWFAKQYYPQTRKEGMIIDDRYNGGGNVSPMIIERLRRELSLAEAGRNSNTVFGKPDKTMAGPMVCLINEQSMSDGDLFPFQFKDMGLGPVIGKRSWGGVVGIYGSLPLLDGSSINKPEIAHFSAKTGQWVLEGVGMTPDFDVDNHPAKEYEGIDEQLLFGIQKVLEMIPENKKPQMPKIPPYPIKK